jgi:hypothetical protein
VDSESRVNHRQGQFTQGKKKKKRLRDLNVIKENNNKKEEGDGRVLQTVQQWW